MGVVRDVANGALILASSVHQLCDFCDLIRNTLYLAIQIGALGSRIASSEGLLFGICHNRVALTQPGVLSKSQH